jgi:folate-binding protein YgfZ
VLVEGLVTAHGDDYWFDIEAGLAADFVRRMKMYRLRAKADIEQTQKAVAWSPDASRPPKGEFIQYRDERGPIGTRFIIDWEDLGGEVAPPFDVYVQAKINAGVLELGPDFGVNEVFPHDIGMDLLNGIDFKKGCYIGQEVVSRMQHRGTARRRPVVVSGLPTGTASGSPVLVGEREAGTIATVAEGRGIAALRLDRIPHADAATVGGIPVKLAIPAWGSYEFGESGSAE